jgi:hypothetical protein
VCKEASVVIIISSGWISSHGYCLFLANVFDQLSTVETVDVLVALHIDIDEIPFAKVVHSKL